MVDAISEQNIIVGTRYFNKGYAQYKYYLKLKERNNQQEEEKKTAKKIADESILNMKSCINKLKESEC